MNRTILIILVCVLSVVLAAMLGVTIYLNATQGAEPAVTTPVPTTTPEPTTTPAPTTTPQPTTTAPDTTPEITTTPPETTPEPQPTHYTLSFVGDCTFANVQGTTGAHTFVGTVGDDYAYPFADVVDIFQADECTFINLECVLSTRGKQANKMFTFRGKPEYINILTLGSVEYAGIVNNHTMDYGKDAYDDTLAALDGAGIHYVETKSTKIFTTANGLKIGVYAHNFPYETTGIKTAIKSLRDAGAEIVVVNVHWGEEYYFKPNGTQKSIAHYAIEGGADIVWGSHPHVLQPIEYYKDGVIFYSLGNFSFGGNNNPADKDTAILQMDIIRELDGTVHLGEVNIIPCFVSGILTYGNDYQPVPMDPEVDKDAWDRVMRKLNGTYEKERLPVSYRDDIDPPATTPGETSPGETLPGETTPGETTPGAGGETTPGGSTDQGGETPDQGGDTPDQGGETPDQGGETPDQGGDTPDQGGEAPDQGRGTPDQGRETPDQGGSTPDQGGDTPDQGGEAGDTPAA